MLYKFPICLKQTIICPFINFEQDKVLYKSTWATKKEKMKEAKSSAGEYWICKVLVTFWLLKPNETNLQKASRTFNFTRKFDWKYKTTFQFLMSYEWVF